MATAPPVFNPVDQNCADTPQPSFAHDLPGGSAGHYVAPVICVGTLDYSTSECADIQADYIASLGAEALNIAGGPVNVFPMLGVHNQGSTSDLTGTGYPLSSGTPTGYNVADAFNVNPAAWRSVQTGIQVTSAPAFLGYSFGNKKAWGAVISGGVDRYYPAAPVRKQVSSIKLKQSANLINRAQQVRVEASDDGVTWLRIDVVNIPDSAGYVTLAVRSSAAYNQWRIIPTLFSGVAANTFWEVVEIQLLEAAVLAIDNIQDFFLLENRDRSYSRTSVMLKCQYDLLDVQTELAKFGINLPQTYIFTCSFAMMIQILGRPILVGDVLELPGEAQFDPSLRPVRKWLEVTDTAWATEGYAHNWKPTLFKFYGQPIMPSIEYRDLMPLPGVATVTATDDDFLTRVMQNDQAQRSAANIAQTMSDLVPQTGSDPANIQSGAPLIKAKGLYDGNDLYSEDAMPPNGSAFTVGDVLPLGSTIAVGHYHRQTYTNVNAAIRPADRLLTWDGARWRVIESNTRVTYESHKKSLSRILNSPDKLNPDSIV
jgi:hypothetical protein